MANHQKPITETKAEQPKVKWGSIVQTEKGWHLATMTTQGGKTLEQSLHDADSKADAEEHFRIWAARELMGWGDDA